MSRLRAAFWAVEDALESALYNPLVCWVSALIFSVLMWGLLCLGIVALAPHP